jgi:hypothetical protein
VSYSGKTLEERFWAKVHKTDGCWLWTGGHSHGYGNLARTKQEGPILAHRYSYELAYGSFPAELHVLHTCDTPRCVRPDHLFLGTHQDNIADMARKGRRAQGEKVSERLRQQWRQLSPEAREEFRRKIRASWAIRKAARAI